MEAIVSSNVNPHYRDGDTCRPSSGIFQRHEMKPFTGWRSFRCNHCGKVVRVFFMKSGGGQITRFWAEGHERIPSGA